MKRSFEVALMLTLLGSGPVPAEEARFAHLAEGYTAADARSGIVAGQRMFSVPTFGAICAPLEAPARLAVITPEPVRLVRGEWFTYDRLVVQAVDASGRLLPPVPITVEVEDVEPAVLNLRSDFTADPNGQVLPVRAGSFRFRFSTLCPGETAAAILRAEVVEP